MKRLRLCVAAIAGLAGGVGAMPFDNSTGGPATATVGVSGEYQNLVNAAAAFNAVAGGLNRPWTLLIANETSEPSNVCFGNTFGADGSLTIRPAPGAQPRVAIAGSNPVQGWRGRFIIGANLSGQQQPPSNTNTFSTDGRYVIDGCNAPGGSSRDMTWTIDFPTFAPTGVESAINVVGDNDGVVIRNLNVEHRNDSGSYACIQANAGFVSGAAVAPDGLLIENCHLVAPGPGSNGFGVSALRAVGASLLPEGTAIQDLEVRHCWIEAIQRGIFLQAVGSHSLHHNRIEVSGQTSGGFINAGIFHFQSNGASGWSAEYWANDISVASDTSVTQRNQGNIGIWSSTSASGGSYWIHDNVVRRADIRAVVAEDPLMRGIHLRAMGSTYVVEHNSINLNVGLSTFLPTVGNVAGIHLQNGASPETFVVRNNIVRVNASGELRAPVIMNTSSAETVVSEGNNLVPVGDAIVGQIGSTSYETLSEWQAAGFDTPATGGQSVDPLSTFPGYWTAGLRFLHFADEIGTVASSESLVDIDGNARPATGALPGASQPLRSLFGGQPLDEWTPFTHAAPGALGPDFPGDASVAARHASDDEGDLGTDVEIEFASTEGMSFVQVFSPGGLIGFDDETTMIVRFNATTSGFASPGAEPLLRFRWFYGANGNLGGGTVVAHPLAAAAEASRTYTMMFEHLRVADQTQLELAPGSQEIRANAVTLAFETMDFDDRIGGGLVELNSVGIDRVDTAALVAASTVVTEVTDFSDPAQVVITPPLNWTEEAGVTVETTPGAATLTASFANTPQSPPMHDLFGNAVPLSFGGISRAAFAPSAAPGRVYRATVQLAGSPNTDSQPLPLIALNLATYGASPERAQLYTAEATISPRQLHLLPGGPAINAALRPGEHSVHMHLPEGGEIAPASPLGEAIGASVRLIDNADDLGGTVTVSELRITSAPESILP